MLRNLLLLVVLFADVRGCHLNCKDGIIHGIFFMFDGSRTVESNWNTVSVRISTYGEPVRETLQAPSQHTMPVWFIQWSGTADFCGIKWWDLNKNASWDCYGEHDPCSVGWEKADGSKCPKTQEEHLPGKWTDSEFDAASDRIFTLLQNGWTNPWGYLKNAASSWVAKKRELGLPKGARALVVFVSDGEAHDVELENETVKEFKEANLKFFGINEHTQKNFGFEKYYPHMDNPSKPDVIETTEFNDDLIKKILTGTCH